MRTPRPTPKHAKAKRQGPGLPVYRDPAFVRLVADHAFVMSLGRDVDFAFLAVGPSLQRVAQRRVEDGQIADMQVEPAFNEVARVRISPIGAVTMAMNVLQQLIASGDASKSAIMHAIEEMEEPSEDEDDDEDSGAEPGTEALSEQI